jgi:hypothetical protein
VSVDLGKAIFIRLLVIGTFLTDLVEFSSGIVNRVNKLTPVIPGRFLTESRYINSAYGH